MIKTKKVYKGCYDIYVNNQRAYEVVELKGEGATDYIAWTIFDERNDHYAIDTVNTLSEAKYLINIWETQKQKEIESQKQYLNQLKGDKQ